MIHGTDSGRLSSRAVRKGPQLQNIPKSARKIFKVLKRNNSIQREHGQRRILSRPIQPDATTRSLEQFLRQHYGPPALSRFQGIDLLVYGSDTPAQ